jgi:hypothetical protein
MPLRLLRLLYATWFVGVIWLAYLSILRFQAERRVRGLLSRALLLLLWPLSLLTRAGRAALLPKTIDRKGTP